MTHGSYKALIGLAAALLLSGCAGVAPRDRASFEPPAPSAMPDYRPVDGSIYSRASARPLFEDLKARNVGDLLTIVLVESTNASKSASTTTNKESSVDMPLPTIFGSNKGKQIFDNSVEANRDFSGAGDSSQSNSLSGTITVSVVDVYPNGNLLVRGQKSVWLNQGEEYVQISGIVRPEDISADNRVSSNRVANARIAYAGTGALADANAQGWLSRFFNSPIWPF